MRNLVRLLRQCLAMSFAFCGLQAPPFRSYASYAKVGTMEKAPDHRMTVDEFLAWAETQEGRYELHGGEVFSMAAERTLHAEMKFSVQSALHAGIKEARLPCFMLPDGMTVRISNDTAHEPDALVYCGPKLPANAIEVPYPVIVVEVLSPSTRRIDASKKLAGYFSLPGLHHYLIVDPERPPLIHHQRQADGTILTRLVGEGVLRLDPPGFEIKVNEIFG
jgi:Uma2 family endonuclease